MLTSSAVRTLLIPINTVILHRNISVWFALALFFPFSKERQWFQVPFHLRDWEFISYFQEGRQGCGFLKQYWILFAVQASWHRNPVPTFLNSFFFQLRRLGNNSSHSKIELWDSKPQQPIMLVRGVAVWCASSPSSAKQWTLLAPLKTWLGWIHKNS